MKIQCLSFLFALLACRSSTLAKPFQIGEHVPVIISSGSLSTIKPDIEHIGEAIKKTYTIVHQNATYISVHFAEFDFDTGCRMHISGTTGVQHTFLTNHGRSNLNSFWAPHVQEDTMKLELYCDDDSKKAHFLINDYVAGSRDIIMDDVQERRRNLRGDNPFSRRDLSICGSKDMRNAQCYKDDYPTEYNTAKAVARIIIQGSGVCTGFLVKNNLLITNEHCISNQNEALNSDFEFMYESSNGNCQRGGVHEPTSGRVVYNALELVAASARHDYAIIRLEGDPNSEYGYLELDNRLPEVGENIYIPQHPAGRDKAIGISDTSASSGNCQIGATNIGSCMSAAPYDDIGYTCDTEGGSSGSPVISRATNKVVALHHCGGGCRMNAGVPIVEIYDRLAAYIPHLSPLCPNWCVRNPKPWSTKCTWEACEGCDACGASLDSPAPTPAPTFSPTASPTLDSTAPTFLPTTEPTPLPTPVSTASPTRLPTISPFPTLVPSTAPTPLPTSISTPFPTLVPSTAPTPLPTSIPTAAECPNWCVRNQKPWSTKCTWEACKGCDACGASLDSSVYVACGDKGRCSEGDSRLALQDELHEVRCCSDAPKSGWRQNSAFGCSVNGESNLLHGPSDDRVCHREATYSEAVSICDRNDARLCTKEEVLDHRCTKGSGCRFDLELVWTSTTASGN